MTIANLISKLKKTNVAHTILENNGYNKDIKFSINGKTFKAGFTEGKTIIEYFFIYRGYNNSEQETERRFFDNFAKVLKYANS